MKKFKIEVGKRYVRRDGKITGVIGYNPDNTYYPFCDNLNRYIYTESGGYYGWIESPLDLVSEYQENTVSISKEFVLEAHKAACSDWKQRIEKEVPDLFPKPEVEVGKWYKLRDMVFFCTGIRDEGLFDGYGFINGKWLDDTLNKECAFCKPYSDTPTPATEEVVREMLYKEAEKRYGMGWWNVELVKHANGNEVKFKDLHPLDFSFDTGKIWVKSGILYEDGKWAEAHRETIVEVTLEEVAKKIGVDVKNLRIKE